MISPGINGKIPNKNALSKFILNNIISQIPPQIKIIIELKMISKNNLKLLAIFLEKFPIK